MLAVASPIALPPPSDFSRPSKDVDGPQQLPRGSGLDALLEDTVEFVEGSSTGVLAQAEPKYPYINISNDENNLTSRPLSPSKSPAAAPTPPSPLTLRHPLYDRPIITSWMITHEISAGFINTGNTCFLNSVLQCLIHTPPLQRLLNQHGTSEDKCRVSDNFCMACNLNETMKAAFVRKPKPFIPIEMVRNLHRIAKHMRRGRQEDAHEFLRYSVDALQRSCLAGYPPKLDPKIAETTWVHRLFGGQLRSRVTCNACGHPSDTFDAILDLSLDIQSVGSVRQALAKFVQVDYLRGANKYKCERCQKPVNAEKQFTVHEAPICLTVHLKRFTPLGRKIGHTVEYEHTLDLQHAMSEGQHGPRYTLYGVISHAGTGPNSGHYYAHVKGPDGYWYDANDESVTRCTSATVVGRKSAYMLFYMRQQGDALGEAIGLRGTGGQRVGKRKNPTESDEDHGVLVDRTAAPPSTPKRPKSEFIGPRLPPLGLVRPDPQAVALQAKIARAEAAKSAHVQNVSLVPYPSDEEEEDGELRETVPTHSSPTPVPPSSSSATIDPRSSSPISAPSFYGNSQPKKRRNFGGHDTTGGIFDSANGDPKRRRPSPPSENERREKSQSQPRRSFGTPFTTTSMSNNLHASREVLGQGQGHIGGFNPVLRGPKQRIAGIGIHNVKRVGVTARMKPRSLM